MNEDKLRQFTALVEKWSPKINLVSKADIPHLWERHVQDSLAWCHIFQQEPQERSISAPVRGFRA